MDPKNPFPQCDTVLVLGGGGMRGMAHIGVLAELERLGIKFDAVVGTSIGSLIGAMVAAGNGVETIREIVSELDKDDYFKLNAIKFLLKGIRTPSIYQGAQFRRSLERLLPEKTMAELEMPFWCNSVALESGANVFWGAPGFEHVSCVDAVYASCALPGVFEPYQYKDMHYMDGGIVDPLPLRWARLFRPKRIIAVDLTIKGTYNTRPYKQRAVGALFRSFEITQEVIVEQMLHMHSGDDVILIQPKVGHLHRFDFDEVPDVIEAGAREARRVLLSHPATREEIDPARFSEFEGAACSVAPAEYVSLHLDPAACVGCGLCTMVCETEAYGLGDGIAEVLKPHNYECCKDYACARNCPTRAIRLGNL
ncbi:MAG: NTE family protein [Planctomycetota bacterium]|jgi:NTE family protein